MPDAKDDAIVIKVETEDPKHSYYVQFTKGTHRLKDVREYRLLYAPFMGAVPPFINRVIEAARVALAAPREVTSKETASEDHV